MFREVIVAVSNMLPPPINNTYLYDIESVIKATKILLAVLKNGVEELSLIERIIERLLVEIRLLGVEGEKSEYNWEDLKGGPTLEEKQELIRLLFKLLGNMVIRVDPSNTYLSYLNRCKHI